MRFGFNNVFPNRVIYEIMWKNIMEWAEHRWQYNGCAIYAVYLRLKTHTIRML